MLFGKTEKIDRHVIAFPKIGPYQPVQLGLIAAAFVYLYAFTLPPLVLDWWEDPNYSHGFVVPFLSAYFAWERRDRLHSVLPQPSAWGLVPLLGGLVLLFLGSIAAELFLTRMSGIVVISGLVLYLFGWKVLKVLSFPIGFLIFMIPLPSLILNTVAFPLQLFAAKVSTFCLQIIDIPVFRDGNIIHLPYTTLEVAEACSGIRSLVALTALSVVFAYMTQRSAWKQSILILSAVPIAIVANAFRVWGTGFLAHLYGMEIAEGFYHTFAGWLVFVLAFGFLLVEGCALSLFQSNKASRPI